MRPYLLTMTFLLLATHSYADPPRKPSLPKITQPIMFDTPQADRILRAMQIFPKDNPWNTDISKWPLHPNSKKIVQSIGPNKPLRYNRDMSFIIVPPNQKKVPVKITHYPGESDKGPYPVPNNVPIEGWPVHYKRDASGRKFTLDQVQRDKAPGDRHAIVVDPTAGRLYEFYIMRKSDRGWQAAQASIFNLNANKLRPQGWTSADAAGLPIFPAIVRYDEIKRRLITHAMRFTVRKSRRAYIYPARHYASRNTDPNLPRMGERFRLRPDFDTSTFSPPVKTILEALKKYGMFVADNGIEWAISVAPDARIPILHKELRRIRGRDFQVVIAPKK